MFLPSPNASSDAFWSGLDFSIKDLIKRNPVLRSRNRRDLRFIGDVLILTDDAKDQEGCPLFDDAANDLFLSPKYPKMAVDILKDYGLEPLSLQKYLDLVERDLVSSNSKMHGRDTTDEWHSAVARSLSKMTKNSSTAMQRRLKSLCLLPLRSGVWTSTTSGPVYFPTTGGIDIPDRLDLKVISLSASNNSDRNTLFQHLGVCQATNDHVRASIFRSFGSDPLSFNHIQAYLGFLYLTHQDERHKREGYAAVDVKNGAWERKSPHLTDMYLPGTDHAYSPASLLATREVASLCAEFLHHWHMENVPDRPSSSHPSWERWLCDSLGILERLRLISRDEVALSDAFLYVHEHRPEEFLGLFQHLWLHEKSNLIRNRALRSKIEDLPAEKLCRVSFPLKLGKTWLPLKALKDLAERYMVYPEQFPFLKLEESDMTQQVGSKWNFLCDYFSVRKDDGIDFLLKMLWCMEFDLPEPSFGPQTQKVFDLYVAIYAQLAATDDSSEARRKVKYVQKCFVSKCH